MSQLAAFAAIQGAYNIVSKAEGTYKKALEKYGPDKKLEFPNTAYYLPIIYSILGIPVKTLGDAQKPMEIVRKLLPRHVKNVHHLPDQRPLLDAGMAAILAEEVAEAIRYVEDPNFYLVSEEIDEAGGKIWLGAAEDTVFRKRGIQFIDGTAPGFAAIVGAAPDPKTAKWIAEEYQKRNLYVFMVANQNSTTFAEQLLEAGVQIGWNTRLVPLGPDISAIVFALGFANRAAMAFGGVNPGDYRKVILYNKDRIFGFVNALGEVNAVWGAHAAGCANWGFPTLADTDIPEILPTGVCTYEHVVANAPHRELPQRSLEVRRLKVAVFKLDIPIAYGPAFGGERVRGEDIYLECGGGRTLTCEWTTSRDMNEVEDGRIEVIGPDVKDVKPPAQLPLAIVVEVAGRQMQEDFEPILERQIHRLINYAHGLMHIGQRDIAWVRISKAAVEKGFTLRHIGDIIHAKYHQDFGNILDKVQVRLYTEKEMVQKLQEQARKVYQKRDDRIEGMTDESEDTFYSCTICQSFAPTHVCIITPERTGLCGAYNWLDGKASFGINPTGPNQPVPKKEVIDPVLGQWKGVNEFVFKASCQKLAKYNLYSLMVDPMTSCGCFECIAAVLPMCNGIMVVNRDFAGMTPCGMKFTTLAGLVGGGAVTPGLMGHSKHYLGSKKFIMAEGGIKRLVWMPKMLKEELMDRLKKRGQEIGISNFPEMIADETIGTTEDEILPFLTEKGHPALTLPSLF